uniref:J domain-containing protein n=1 Tax=viral metagenome TaxID=1070528 RepID=A0A6C0E6D6_9ZZZZ
MEDSHYTTLGVDENASHDDIKKAFRVLSLKWHPDRNNEPGAVEKFQKINEAYEHIGDDEKRSVYDAQRRNPFSKLGMGGMNGMGGGMEHDILNAFFGGLGGMGGLGAMFQGGGGFPGGVQMFTTSMDGTGRTNVRVVHKPSPISKNITITMEQVYAGCKVPVEIERHLIENNMRVLEKETIYVDIPPGIDEGEIICIPDKGNSINGSKSDVKVFVKIAPDPVFQRSGLDLIINQKISFKDSLCGFSIEFKYINGKVYTLNNANGTIIYTNYKKVMPNMGLKRDNHTGNMIINFNVDYPEKLTDEQVEKLRNIL